MNISDQELLELKREGAKIIVQPAAPVPGKAAEKPSDGAQIATEVRALTAAMTKLATREVETPDVTVEAPRVTVKPEINIHTARTCIAEVLERDDQGKWKKIKFSFID